MDELRRATDDYMRQLQRQQAQEGDQQQENAPQGDTMQMTQDDLQRMMDRIQELMEQGRMAEAEQALRELQQLMENMRVTEGQPGQQGQSPSEQAMEGLADTLRDQQGLSDQAFRDLQDRIVKPVSKTDRNKDSNPVQARNRARTNPGNNRGRMMVRRNRARAKGLLRIASRLCATSCAASKVGFLVVAPPRGTLHGMHWIVQAVPWMGPKTPCAEMIWPKR